MTQKKEYTCKVVSKEFLTPDTAYIGIECPEAASSAVPGQFVNISCSKFLKRPFGVASVSDNGKVLYVGIKVVGKGTEELSGIEAGTEISMLAPLGNGFDLESYDSYILVSGGTGVFPINFTYETLKASGKKVTVVQGFRNASQVILNDPSFILTTDEGDAGIKGTCIAGLDTIDLNDHPNATVLCVGPKPMMKATGEWAESHGLKCFVSMEQRMGCGIGICLCCTVKTKADNEDGYYNKRCCKDGPVFDYAEVIW